jgi:hypothetical protein
MDTLPLPVIADLTIQSEATSKEIKYENNTIVSKIKTSFRVVGKKSVDFSIYLSDYRVIDAFLMENAGKPFLWNSNVWFCTGYSLDYQSEYKALLNIKLVIATNY